MLCIVEQSTVRREHIILFELDTKHNYMNHYDNHYGE